MTSRGFQLASSAREHLGKILACLMPLLVNRTAGELGQLLPPNAGQHR